MHPGSLAANQAQFLMPPCTLSVHCALSVQVKHWTSVPLRLAVLDAHVPAGAAKAAGVVVNAITSDVTSAKLLIRSMHSSEQAVVRA